MALPSQTARAMTGRSYRSRPRRRRQNRPLMIGGALILVVGGIVGYFWFGGEPRAAEASPALERTSLVTPPPEPAPQPVREIAARPPAERPVRENREPVIPPPDAVAAPEPVEARKAAAETPAAPVPKPDTPKHDRAPVASNPAPAGAGAPADVQSLLREADAKMRANELVAARDALNRALHNPRTPRGEAAAIRDQLARLNEDLVFSPTVYRADPLSEAYAVKSGDSLGKIVSRLGLAVEPGLIARVNRLANPNSIRDGQKLKLVRGPFHAVVSKSAYRLDLYAGDPGDRAGWTYIRSFRVGLGEGDSTPIGEFVVRRNSKLVNPYWVNPRTGEKFDADDPKNPIGERWLGLQGVGAAEAYVGYGIHGTIEPDSIGQMRSMGCVRMASPDVELVYDLLAEAVSEVKIEP